MTISFVHAYTVPRTLPPEALEAEASWLGPTLLVPRAGLITVLQREARLETAAKHFEVSVELARFVYNTRGCRQYVRLTA
jgi:Zn-dependent peptidase ImmA (M78 family)